MSKRTASEPAAGEASEAKQARLDANGVMEAEFKPPPPDIPTLQYKEGRLARDFVAAFRNGRTQMLVVVPPEALLGSSRAVKARQLWGDETYTDDSDLVAVLLHLGYYHAPSSAAPSPLIARFYAQVELLPPQDSYPSAFRNAVRSRGWYSRVEGCSYKVERCWLVTRSSRNLELQQRAGDAAVTHATFALSANDRQISTRSTAGSSRNKPVSEVTVLYSLCNEPWLKYCMAAIADRGLRPGYWTSARLRDEALYLETAKERFELSCTPASGAGGGGSEGGAGAGGDGAAAAAAAAGQQQQQQDGKELQQQPDGQQQQQDTYTFARCKQLLPVAGVKRLGVPLPPEEVEVLEAGLSWDDIQWANMTVTVRGTSYKMLRMQFLPRGKA